MLFYYLHRLILLLNQSFRIHSFQYSKTARDAFEQH